MPNQSIAIVDIDLEQLRARLRKMTDVRILGSCLGVSLWFSWRRQKRNAKQKTDKHEDVRLPECKYKVGDRALVSCR